MAKKDNPAQAAVPARMSGEDRRWRAEDAIRTLTRAEEIRGDKGLMRDVARHAQQQAAALKKVAGGASSSKPAGKGKR
jgi:hypothetical protein